MFCTKCGTRNDDTNTVCTSCGNPLRPASYGTPMEPASPPPQAVVPPTPPAGYPQAPIAQAYAQPMATGVTVPNYLVQAILVTVLCCLPFGIVSIIYAAQVNSKLAIGDIAGATQSSRSAKMWAWIGFGIGGLWVVGATLLFVFSMAAGLAGHATHVR